MEAQDKPKSWLPVVQRGILSSLESSGKAAVYGNLIASVIIAAWAVCQVDRWNLAYMLQPILPFAPFEVRSTLAIIVLVLYFIVHAAASVGALVGIKRGEPSRLSPYLVLQYVHAIVFFNVYVSAIPNRAVLCLIGSFVATGYCIYSLLCINSLRNQMQSDNSQRGFFSQPISADDLLVKTAPKPTKVEIV